MLDAIRDPDGGYFDARFFAFFEDLDLAWRARRRGWRARYRPSAVGYHARGGSAERRGARFAILSRRPEVQWYILRNRWLSILRNDDVASYVSQLPFVLLRECAAFLLLLVRPKLWRRAWQERALFRRARKLRALDEAAVAPQVGP